MKQLDTVDELAKYGSVEWQIRDILKRNHSAKDCPQKGTCLNEDNATKAIMKIVREAKIKELEFARMRAKQQDEGTLEEVVDEEIAQLKEQLSSNSRGGKK